jgi:hypothetical protein
MYLKSSNHTSTLNRVQPPRLTAERPHPVHVLLSRPLAGPAAAWFCLLGHSGARGQYSKTSSTHE